MAFGEENIAEDIITQPARRTSRVWVSVACQRFMQSCGRYHVVETLYGYHMVQATSMPCGHAAKHVCKILNNFLFLNRFLCLSLNENLLLLNFLSHFFHFVPCIWEF